MSENNVGASAPVTNNDPVESIESVESNEASPAEQAALEALDGQDSQNVKDVIKEVERSLKKKIKIKVDGEESEEEIDFDDEESLRKHLQLSKVSQKRMNEYSQLEKEVRHFIEELKKNPRKVLSDPTIGIDIKQLASQVIEEEIENSKKTPQQLEKEKLESELRAMKEEREQERREAQRKEFERLEQQAAERYDTMITSALQKGELPKTPYVVKKIADYMYIGLQEGLDITPEDVLPLVKEEMQNDVRQMFSVLPENVIEQLLGVETINKLRKKRIDAVKKAPIPARKAIKDVGSSQKNEVEAEKVSFKKFFGV